VANKTNERTSEWSIRREISDQLYTHRLRVPKLCILSHYYRCGVFLYDGW